MDDTVETLLVDVRASTAGFAQDIEALRGTIDTNLVGGFARAGDVLERGLLGAIRRGSLGFDDLKRIALQTIDSIALQAVQQLSGSLDGSGGGLLGGALNLGSLLGAVLGLPGRATGGPVAPGRGYLVGERGPELFVPTSAGRIEPGASSAGAARDVRVAITINASGGTSAPQALQRSSRQIAGAVRRALNEA